MTDLVRHAACPPLSLTGPSGSTSGALCPCGMRRSCSRRLVGVTTSWVAGVECPAEAVTGQQLAGGLGVAAGEVGGCPDPRDDGEKRGMPLQHGQSGGWMPQNPETVLGARGGRGAGARGSAGTSRHRGSRTTGAGVVLLCTGDGSSRSCLTASLRPSSEGTRVTGPGAGSATPRALFIESKEVIDGNAILL
jgi:hypothetical protein